MVKTTLQLLIAMIALQSVVYATAPIQKQISNNKQTIEFWKQPYISNMDYSKINASKKDASTGSATKEKVQGYLKNNKKLGFKENKGQMADANGRPTPFVLFKAEAPNLNIWVTTTGLTYQFFKIEEEHEGRGKTKDNIQGIKYNIQKELGHEKETEGEWHRVDMVLKNATIKQENIIRENDITQGAENYYLGHCPNGIFNVKTYTKIIIKEIYKGIDWVLYTANGGLKHDFIVHPQADLKQIKLLYEGSGEFEVENNQIHFKNEIGELTEGKLLCYQGSETNEIIVQYDIIKNKTAQYLGAGNINDTGTLSGTEKQTKHQNNKLFSYELSIALDNYNINEILVIDPQLVWSTFYGGNLSQGTLAIDCDPNNNVYIAGYTGSTNFPLQNLSGAYNQTVYGGTGLSDLCIFKFDNAGSLVWATYYGGNQTDFAQSIAINSNNQLYVTGRTNSTNFPIQSLTGAYNQAIFGGGQFEGDAFILKFNPFGIRLWASYYGGSGIEEATSIAINSNDEVYVLGRTTSFDFPIQNLMGAYNQSIYVGGTLIGRGDLFILKFSSVGARLWSTYYGGSLSEESASMAINQNNEIYITGCTESNDFPIQSLVGAYNQTIIGGNSDLFILKFDNSCARLWATYYGGSGYEGNTGNLGIGPHDSFFSIEINGNNDVYITGSTQSIDFPIQNLVGAYNQIFSVGTENNIFILKFNSLGVCLWATAYGGTGNELCNTNNNIIIDSCENVFISFNTNSNDIFTMSSANPCAYYDGALNGALNFNSDIFLVKFNSAGSLQWATYFGGDGHDFREALAIDSQNNLLVTGEWWGSVSNASSYPLTNSGNGAYFDNTPNGIEDIYIAKFNNQPIIIQTQINPTFCLNNGIATVSLTCGEAPYSYVWSNGYSVENTTLSVNSSSNLASGVHQVTVTSSCNNNQVISFTLTSSSGNVSVTVTNAPCGLTTGTIILNNLGFNTLTITEGTNTITTTATNSFAISNVTIGTHTYVITNNGDGCVNIITATAGQDDENITVNAGITEILTFGATTQLHGTASANTSYTWFPSSTLSCINCLNPTASPTVTTIYTLTATDANGCQASSIVQIIVKERCSDNNAINLPNAFSPNGDGTNDVFCIQDGQSCINEVSLIVYDRWGEKVFETSSPAFCWDGTYKGKLLNSSVFVYYAKASFTNGKKIEKKGNVTLLR